MQNKREDRQRNKIEENRESMIEGDKERGSERGSEAKRETERERQKNLQKGYSSLPIELKLFHRYILQSFVGYYFYYFLFFCFLFGFLYLLISSGREMFSDSIGYNLYFILQTLFILVLFPLQLSYLQEILSSSDLLLMFSEVLSSEIHLKFWMGCISFCNIFLYLISIFFYSFLHFSSHITSILTIAFFLVIFFPLPLSITVSLILMDCHRRLAERFIASLQYSLSYSYSHSLSYPLPPSLSHPLLPSHSQSISQSLPLSQLDSNQQINTSSPMISPLFSLLSDPLNPSQNPSLCSSLSCHISSLYSHYYLLRSQYLYTSQKRGTLITLLILNSLLLMFYLLWTIYLFTPTFLSILGFLIVDFMILIEVFVWTARANEAGYQITEALSDHSLILFNNERLTNEQKQQLTHLITCLPYSRIEIYGIGKFTIRFKLAVSITIAFAAAIIPKLIL